MKNILMIIMLISQIFAETSLTEKIQGKWVYDNKQSMKLAKSVESRNVVKHFSPIYFIFDKNGNYETVENTKGKIIIKSDSEFEVELTPENFLKFSLKDGTLFSTYKWTESLTVYPVFVPESDYKPEKLDISPLEFNTLYRITEMLDGKGSYCMFLESGNLVFAEKPFTKVTDQMLHTNVNHFDVIDGKILVNGGMMKITIQKNGFILNNQGLKVKYIPN